MAIRRVDGSERFADSAYIVAQVQLLPEDAGGRRSPIISGYRPTFLLATASGEAHFDASIFLEDVDELVPGGSVAARLSPHLPEYWVEVEPNMELGIYEGRRRVGTALVVAVLDHTSAR